VRAGRLHVERRISLFIPVIVAIPKNLVVFASPFCAFGSQAVDRVGFPFRFSQFDDREPESQARLRRQPELLSNGQCLTSGPAQLPDGRIYVAFLADDLTLGRGECLPEQRAVLGDCSAQVCSLIFEASALLI